MSKNEPTKMHPLCELLPPMAADEFKDLCDDIANHGVLNPVVIYEGKILDGRNRWTAAMKTGRKCPMVEYRGAMTAAEFVVAQNINRRHLDGGQRAALAAKIYEYHAANNLPILAKGGQNPPSERAPTQADAARMVGADLRETKRAVRVLRESPEAIKAVAAGTMTLRQAEASIAPPPPPPDDPPVTLDRAGKPIEIPALIPVLTETDTDEIIALLDEAGKKLHKLRDTIRGRYIRQDAEIDIRNAREAVKFGQPFASCPYCAIAGGKICKLCGNAGGHTKPPNCGWISRGLYNTKAIVPDSIK